MRESYGFPVAPVLKNLPASTGDAGDVCISDVRSLNQEDPLEEEMANLLWHSCLGNPMDRGAWQTTVHGFTEG